MKYVLQIIVIALALSVGYYAARHAAPAQEQTVQQKTVFDKIMETKTLRCGYIVWPPEFDKNLTDGKMSGISYDIITEAANRLGLRVEWVEEANFATMTEGLAINRYDALCFSLYRMAKNAPYMEMSTPWFYSGQGIFVRKDEIRFSAGRLDVLNNPDVTIAVIDGEMSSIIAKDRFPKAKTISLPQNSAAADALLNVTTKKADLTFVNITGAALFEKNNPGLVVNLDPEHPVALFSHGMMFKKGEIALKNMFDVTIEEMHAQGIIKNILGKYPLPPGSYLNVAQPYATPQK